MNDFTSRTVNGSWWGEMSKNFDQEESREILFRLQNQMIVLKSLVLLIFWQSTEFFSSHHWKALSGTERQITQSSAYSTKPCHATIFDCKKRVFPGDPAAESQTSKVVARAHQLQTGILSDTQFKNHRATTGVCEWLLKGFWKKSDPIVRATSVSVTLSGKLPGKDRGSVKSGKVFVTLVDFMIAFIPFWLQLII
jgi:hypothetical protein